MMLTDKVNNRCPNKKSGRMTQLIEEEKSLKFYIEYMASINYPLSIPAVKGFALSIIKKASKLTDLIKKQGTNNTLCCWKK